MNIGSKWIVITLLCFSMISFSAVGGGGCGSKKKPCGGGSGKCSTSSITEKISPVILQFPLTYPGRIDFTLPSFRSDPNFGVGGTSLFNSSNTYYCVITIVGVECANYVRSYVWDVASRTMDIPIPTHTDYNLSVEFYEQCGNLDRNVIGGGSGRPFYAFSKYYFS